PVNSSEQQVIAELFGGYTICSANLARIKPNFVTFSGLRRRFRASALFKAENLVGSMKYLSISSTSGLCVSDSAFTFCHSRSAWNGAHFFLAFSGTNDRRFSFVSREERVCVIAKTRC